VPVHLQPAYAKKVVHAGLRYSQRAARKVLSLPMYPELRDDEAGQVIEAVRDFCRRETRALAGLSTPGLTRLP
jgi:dTDP-4-amino-4,6-dideoxygalactose transaminase